MIFIANGADFSANNIGTVSIKTIYDIKESTYDFLSHFTKEFRDDEIIAVDDFLELLGYGIEGSIYSKITNLVIPCLITDIETELYNIIDWSNIKEKEYIALDKAIISEGALTSLEAYKFQLNLDTNAPTKNNLSYIVSVSKTGEARGLIEMLQLNVSYFYDGKNYAVAFPSDMSNGYKYQEIHFNSQKGILGVSMNGETINCVYESGIKRNMFEENPDMLPLYFGGSTSDLMSFAASYNNNITRLTFLATGQYLTEDELNTASKAVRRLLNSFRVVE